MKITNKLSISLRYWLLGIAQSNKEYYRCVDALEYAASFHKGVRKDGETPEFQHQLTIAHYLRTLLPSLDHPADTICAALLHDVPEDYHIGFEEITERYGANVATAVELLTKVHRGNKKSNEEYFSGLAKNPIASIVKGADRIHNLQSMPGVFTKEKQQSYIEEAETWIIPALKTARRKFPTQELAYENIKLVMLSQIQLIKISWSK